MSKNIVKNQHYVSEFILRNFANEKKQVVECQLKHKKAYPININRSMSSKYTYEHNKLEQNLLEKYFSKLESKVAPTLKKIVNELEKEMSNTRLVYELVCSIFIELLVFYYRSGALLHEFTSQYGLVKSDEKIELLIKKIINFKYLNDLKTMIVNNYEWSIIKNDKNDFILSDQYISTAALSAKSRFLNITNRHMGLKDVIILIPISSRFYFVFYNGKKPNYIKKEQLCTLNESQTFEINVAILNNSYQKCISCNDEALTRVLDRFNEVNPVGSFAHYNSGYKEFKVKKEVFFYEEDLTSYEFFTSFRFRKYKNLKRNERCVCKSGMKYKNCCLIYVQKAELIFNDFQRNVNPLSYSANPYNIIEQSINEVFSIEEPQLFKDIRLASKK
ncbi:DUF4238 domain-containing protein [Bacillus vallismortis]|uniref:DUF4238 domain-containing protein n=1 Tax=Bacillus vallismortis TaxID=72361 RepID=UPI0013ECB08C|nr:DUF4238 domain-containing protein [Bacillus vallismortis]MBG9768183.1 hypothetical protein [Bacillus vallismortis]